MHTLEQQRRASIFHVVEFAEEKQVIKLIKEKLPKALQNLAGDFLPIYYSPIKRHKKPKIAVRGVTAVTKRTVLNNAASLLDIAYKEIYRLLENGLWSGLCWRVKNSKCAVDRMKGGRFTLMFSYDFATMYDCLPHGLLVEILNYCVDIVFHQHKGKLLVSTVRRDEAGEAVSVCRFVLPEDVNTKSDRIITQNDLKQLTMVVVYNNFIAVHGLVLRQTGGIPQGLGCSPTWSDLMLCFYEVRFQRRNPHLSFDGFVRYIDDLVAKFNLHTEKIYPKVFSVLSTAHAVKTNNFLDVQSSIINRKMYSRIYDKRRDFKFKLNKYTDITSCVPADSHAHNFKSAIIRFYGLNDFVVYFVRDIIECVGFFVQNRTYKTDFIYRAITSLLQKHKERKWLIKDYAMIRKLSVLVNKVYLLMLSPPRIRLE